MPSLTRNSDALISFSYFKTVDQHSAGFWRADNTMKTHESSTKQTVNDQNSSVAHGLDVFYNRAVLSAILFSPNLLEQDGIYIVDKMDEQRAIQRLKRGEVGGLEFLVGRYQVRAVRAAYLITRDIGLAEDVVQDCFIRVYRSIRGFEEARAFEPWFLRSVVNASVKMLQKSARQVQVGSGHEEDESLFAELAARVELVEEQVESIETQNQIWNAMQKLSPRQRAVIVQRYFLDMSEKEMAAESGAAVGTIKWLLNAARERLRMLLAERSEE
jgi:RNA polymerase sigma-70 factor (ECF subfamily)